MILLLLIIAYDAVGQMIDWQDAMGRRTTNVYDALGRQTVERNALNYRTTLSYDALGRQISVQDANNNVTNNLYDARGLLLSVQQPWGAFTTNSYDAVGNLTERVDGRDYRSTISYDALDRVDVSQAMDGALTSHSYDAVGREIGLWDDTILATTTYDALGQVKLVAEQSAGSAAAWSVSYSYDGVGNRTLMSDGEGRRTTYTYLSTPYTNAIVDIQPPYEAVKTRVSWYELYKSTFRFLNNGTASTEYQITRDNGWEAARTHFSGAGSQGAYSVPSYDAAGNRLQMGESNAGGPTTLTHFTYDQTNQLLSERRIDTPGYANTYTYDGTGNRLTQNSLGVRTTYQYGSGNRLLSEQTGADTTNYTYDQNGNLTLIDAAGQLTTQSWNTDNRLTRVENPDGSVEEMSYGADGHRRKKKVTPLSGPASDTIFVYDGQNLMQERDGTGLILANYTWGPDRLNTEAGENWAAGNIGDTVLLQRRASTPGDLTNGTTHYFGTDPSANIRLLIEPAGTVAGRMTYEAFGELFAGSGGILTPFRFGGSLGYCTDALRRLNVGWRVYDPAAGRWTSLDPIGFDGGLWNLYGYVGNNPVNEIDALGLWITFGPVPRKRPVLDPSKADGGTGCNSNAGEPWSEVIDRKCTYSCTIRHEAIHRDDLAVCCSRFAACLKKQTGKGKDKCNLAWIKWYLQNEKPQECKAWTDTVACLDNMWKDQDCETRLNNIENDPHGFANCRTIFTELDDAQKNT